MLYEFGERKAVFHREYRKREAGGKHGRITCRAKSSRPPLNPREKRMKEDLPLALERGGLKKIRGKSSIEGS